VHIQVAYSGCVFRYQGLGIVLHNILLFANAWSKATFWHIVVSIHSPLELLFARWLKWLLA
jgi:hypothetical protein